MRRTITFICILITQISSAQSSYSFFPSAQKESLFSVKGDFSDMCSDCIFGYQAINRLVSNSDTLIRHSKIFKREHNFPNPAQNAIYFMIDLPNISPATLEIFNLEGQLLMRQNIELSNTQNAVNIEHLPQGVYISKIQTNKNAWIGKFVK